MEAEFPNTKDVLEFLRTVKVPATMTSISKRFNVHQITASDMVKVLQRKGLVEVMKVGSAKVVRPKP